MNAIKKAFESKKYLENKIAVNLTHLLVQQGLLPIIEFQLQEHHTLIDLEMYKKG